MATSINSTKRQNSKLVQIQNPCRRQNNVTQNLKFVLGRLENILEKG